MINKIKQVIEANILAPQEMNKSIKIEDFSKEKAILFDFKKEVLRETKFEYFDLKLIDLNKLQLNFKLKKSSARSIL